jgi:hypothetical protein
MSGKIETLLGLLPYRAGTGPLPEVVRTISLRPDLLQAGNSLICPVDQRGLVGLKLVPGALLVGQVGLVDHAGMRVLFHVAPEVLKQEYRAETRFRDLAGCALKVLGRWGLQTNRLAPRGEWLDRQRGTGLASRVLELIQLGVRDGLIRPRQDGAGVVVTHTEFLSCLASWTPHPGLAALGQALSDGRYLVKTRPGAWVINQQVWDLAGSLYQTP